MVDEDQRRVAERAQRNDPDAWDIVYRNVYPRLLAYATRRVGADAADDVVSETMSRAVAGIDKFRPHEAGLDPWLFGIARRVAADHHRKRGRSRVLEATAAAAESEPDPTERLELADEHARVRACFARLSGSDREVLELRVVAGLSAEDVASVLGKRAGTIRTAQSRALARLRDALGDQP